MTDSKPSGEELRRFSRIEFDAPVDLLLGGKKTDATLHDVSLRGAMIELHQDYAGKVGNVVDLTIKLDPQTSVHMHCIVAHFKGNILGLSCEEIDIDSISHLKRLVELNLNDPELLERDFKALYESFHG